MMQSRMGQDALLYILICAKGSITSRCVLHISETEKHRLSLKRLLPHFQVSRHVANISLLLGSKKDCEFNFEGVKQGQIVVCFS